MKPNPVAFPSVPVRLLLTLLVASGLTVLALWPSNARAVGPNEYAEAMVKLQHPSGLQKFAKSVTSPNSSKYQQYRSVNWIVKRFGASKKTKKRAIAWFERRGMDAVVDGAGQNLLVTMRPEQAEPFLGGGASASSLRNGGEGRVPAGLAGIVTDISFLNPDTDRFRTLGAYPPQPEGSPFPDQTSVRPHSGTQTGCAEGQRGAVTFPEGNRNFTPNQYLDAYGVSQLHKSGFKGQGRRIAVIEIDGFKRSDIETFGKCYGKRVPPTKVHLVGIDKPLAPGAETTLDLEVISASAPQLDGIDVYQGSGSELGIMAMVGRALTPKKAPAAISISLGGCEPNLAREMKFRRGLDNLFAVAAGAGITVVVAAGDTGAAACALAGNSAALPLATVSDPASSEWVTATGGTNFELNAQNQILNEFTWNDAPLGLGGGGGGLSILAKSRPWYQQGTKRFEDYGLTRAMPDVVALADSVPGYSVYCTAPGDNGCISQYWPEGGWQPVGGTSAATPLTASLITLVSQRLNKSGKRSIGFANPLLYKLGKSKAYSSVFRDIVAGNNDVGTMIPKEAYGGEPLGCCYTKKGFDLASGWGSIKAIGLAKAAAKHAKRK